MATSDIGRSRRKQRIRRKVAGTASRPRLSVFRSATHIYVQAIDDAAGETLAVATSLGMERVSSSKVEAAKLVGEAMAKALLARGIERVVFDRNGYLYHGRVASLADGARSGGLQF